MSELNLGKVIIDQTKTSQVTVNYADTSKPDTSIITSNRTQMTATVDSISTVFEVSKTYYFDADGGLVTTNQGYGTLGTTDSDGVLTVAHSTPSLALTAPSAGTKYEFEESFNVTWTSSNITLVNVILESESGGSKTYSDVDASLGTLAVAISESDGFSINETVYIYIENTHQTLEDSVQVASIATITINSPTLTAGTEGNVTGTSNGVEVDVYYRVSSPEGAWEVFEEGVAVSGGNWSATGTIPDADTYDFKVEDTTDRDGSAQVGDVVVASGESTENLFVTCLVSSPSSQLLKRLKSDLSHVSKFSSVGTGDNQFNNPRGIAVDDTYIYIVDSGNNRILKWLKSDLSYVSKIGSGGTAMPPRNDEFNQPEGIAVDDTYIYIVDKNNARIQKRLKSDLSYVSKIGWPTGSGDNQFNNPQGIAVDDTYIYIVDTGNRRIQKRLKSDLSYVSKIGSLGSGDDQFDDPYGIAVDDTYIYVSDGGNHRIQKRLKSDLSYVSKIGSSGTGDNQFSSPRGIAVDDTYIYVSDSGNNRIQKRLKSDLSYVSKIGSSGPGNDYMQLPYAMAVEPNYWD